MLVFVQDLLSEDNVSFHYPAETWEEVIRHGGQPHVDAGFTDPSYTEAMVEVVREMGPYIVLAPGLCDATCSSGKWGKT